MQLERNDGTQRRCLKVDLKAEGWGCHALKGLRASELTGTVWSLHVEGLPIRKPGLRSAKNAGSLEFR